MVAYADNRSGTPQPGSPGVQTAALWNPEKLGGFWTKLVEMAKNMEAEGASVSDIFNETKRLTNPREDTGLWRLGDKQWATESTDEGMKIAPGIFSKPGGQTYKMPAGQIMDHPLL